MKKKTCPEFVCGNVFGADIPLPDIPFCFPQTAGWSGSPIRYLIL